MRSIVATFLFFSIINVSYAQIHEIIFEKNRIHQLLNPESPRNSFLFRNFPDISNSIVLSDSVADLRRNQGVLKIEPLFFTFKSTPHRPFSSPDGMLLPISGNQGYLSQGITFNKGILSISLRPEVVLGHTTNYQSISRDFSDEIIEDKYYFYNSGDHPEEFKKQAFARFWWGQSKISLKFKSFEFGASTENIWWGPGQWNSLIFAQNASGFAHLTLNTTKPAKTFLGNFEGQFLVGRLESSNQLPTQNQEWNDRFFRPLPEEWRYINAINFSYSPKWIPNLFLGFSRTVQLYNNFLGDQFLDYFPIFQALQKEKYFENGNSVAFDQKNQSQQVAVYGRIVIPKSKSELYFEFGRRDHAFNWRDFTLNPEHARAFNIGFIQLFELSESRKIFQLRGEITQQLESVNRYVRYSLKGGDAWHTNEQARGFTQFGQPMGVGIGIGSNVQNLEFSLIEEFDKIGLLFQRIENQQAFYYRAFLMDDQVKPWIDLSLGFLYDKKFENLLVSSKLQVIHARNYQWQLDPASTSDFPKGQNLTSVMG